MFGDRSMVSDVETSRLLRRAAFAGAATGLRTSAAMAALIAARDPGLPPLLTRPGALRATAVGTATEFTLDKMPFTPSRLDPPSLGGRVVMAGLAGAVIATGARQGVLPGVLAACGAALVSAKIGHDVRVALAKRLPPFAVATAEDAVAIGLAAAAAAG
jgi:hypothetical protein